MLWSLSDTSLRGAQKYPSKEKEERGEGREERRVLDVRGEGVVALWELR